MGVEDRDWWRDRQNEVGGKGSTPTRAPGDELWERDQRNRWEGGRSHESRATWVFLILLAVAIAGIGAAAILEPERVQDVVLRGKGWVALLTGKSDRVAQREVPRVADGVACDPMEEIRTMSTRWPSAGEALPGRSMELVNGTGQEIFLRLHDAKTGRLTQTALIMPREKIMEPVFAGEMTVQLRLGSVWCNRLHGWKDGRDVSVDSRIRPGAGVVEIVLEPAIGREGLSLVIRQRPNATPSVGQQAQRGEPSGSAAPRHVPKLALQPPQTPDPRRAGIENIREATKRQEALISQLQRQVEGEQRQQSALANRPTLRRTPAIEHGATQAVEEASNDVPQHIAISDWRDVPRRDIRLVTRGDRHFFGGQVAGEDVQFELSLHGHSAIGEGLARAVGATGCQHGPWIVQGRYVGSCRAVVRSVRFGTVELDNVLMVVLPGNRQPVLGPDILGQVQLFKGPDGQYASVGH